MKYYLLLLGLLLFSCKNEQLFTKSDKVSISNNQDFLEIDDGLRLKIYSSAEKNLKLTIPYGEQTIDLSLERQDFDFEVFTDAGQQFFPDQIFYHGTVNGDSHSIANLIFNDKTVVGSISYKDVVLNIGSANKQYSIYQIENDDFECHTADVKETIKTQALTSEVTDKIVTQGFELTYENFQYFGGTQKCVEWITAIFAQVQTFFIKENIKFNLGAVYVHTSPDNYNKSIDVALTEFRSKKLNDPVFSKCNLVQLVRGKTSGSAGGIAYVGGLCNSYGYSVAEPYFSWSAYPAYSWTVNVVGHEIVHNLGSPHTQSCSWEGGAIDGCVPPEGTCARGPIPPKGGGLLISYCHMNPNVGIGLANGLGEKPKNLVYSKLQAATCLSQIVTSSCTDGIQNGNETGIDCGGTCPPCNIIPPSTNGGDVAQGKPATQSSTYKGDGAYPYKGVTPVQEFPASYAFDGNLNTFSRTNREINPWIEVDLQSLHNINSMVVYPRYDCCYNLGTFTINVDGNVIYSRTGSLIRNKDSLMVPVTQLKGRIIRLSANNTWAGSSGTNMQIAAIKVYGTKTDTPPIPIICRDSIILKDTVIKRTIKVDQFGNICK
jgi:hypothetical protein